MSKGLIHPSSIRSGLVDLEMAEETVDLIHKNLTDGQAHLQGEPLDVDSLPEDMRRMRLIDMSRQKDIRIGDEGESSSEDEFYLPSGKDPMVPLQDFLDEIGAQVVKRMKSGDGFFKIWSTVTEDIKGYISSNFTAAEPRSSDNKSVQTEPAQIQKGLPEPPSHEEKAKETQESSKNRQESKPAPSSDWDNNQEEVDDIEGEVAHQVAESFSKKYKFPSRSSGIFLWNFEQLKMNLDDIVKAALNIPGIDKIAEKGGKLPLRCILGYVSLSASKRFCLLADNDKTARLMQDDINNYIAKIEEIDKS
ncbi:phosphoprotein [Lyssavirus shimoni]|uniref:Phosphoprotein n=1 Tax=Lyssavirus shimoni TaxID=746543 RepID=D4NRJ9_9RHAB|nr:phosphoprotein [Lyssavirus shimoni]ADD84508.1 phosphoprotein [Lyssavirus shimoni]